MIFYKQSRINNLPLSFTVQMDGIERHNSVHWLSYFWTHIIELSKAFKCSLKKIGALLVTCLPDAAVTTVQGILIIDAKFSFSSLTVSISFGTRWATSLSSMINFWYSLLKKVTIVNMGTFFLILNSKDYRWRWVRGLSTYGQ